MSSFSGGGFVGMINDPPVPKRDFITLPPTGPITIPITNLLANDFDREGNTPLLSLARTNTTRGGHVALLNGVITHTPSANPHVRGDSFDYIVTDAFGAASVGTVVLVSPAAAPRLTSFQTDGTNIVVRFQGLPGATYMLQVRSAFRATDSWLDYPDASQPLVQSADAAGSVQFTIPVGLANAFFRAADIDSLRDELALTRTGDRLSVTLRGVPNTIYKLQFRASLQPEEPWLDYPSSTRPFLVRAAGDGLYQISAPIARQNGFFRTIPRD